jgi:hypothetical protein
MDHCPICGAEYLSTAAAARQLGVVPQRVRALLARRPGRLRETLVGRHRIIPAAGVAGFQRQPSGVHLVAEPLPEPQRVCVGCSEPFYAPREAAAELGLTLRWIYALLAREPEKLLAFRVGEFWVIPQSGVDAYRRRQQNKAEGGKDRAAPTWEKIVTGSKRQEKEIKVSGKVALPPVEFEIDLNRLPPCRCGAYHFPHRRGSGPCRKERKLRGTYVPWGEVQLAWP